MPFAFPMGAYDKSKRKHALLICYLGSSITNNTKWRGRSQTPRYRLSLWYFYDCKCGTGWRLRLAFYFNLVGSKLRASAWYVHKIDTLIYMAFTRFNMNLRASAVDTHTHTTIVSSFSLCLFSFVTTSFHLVRFCKTWQFNSHHF